jgi:hypothetical protein
MSRIALVRDIMKELSSFLDIPFVRSEQSGDRKDRIFLSYKILSENTNPEYQDIIEARPNALDDTIVDIHVIKDKESIVSINIFGKERDYQECWGVATRALNWFQREGKAFSVDAGVLPKLLSPAIQDRTVYMETEYEVRVGFDVEFEGKEEFIYEENAVDVNATVEDLLANGET